MVDVTVRRGEVWVANLNPNKGGEIGKQRPVVVIQDTGVTEQGLRTVIVAPLTTLLFAGVEPLRVLVRARQRLLKDCHVMTEHIRALDRSRFGEGPLTALSQPEMAAVEKSLRALLGML